MTKYVKTIVIMREYQILPSAHRKILNKEFKDNWELLTFPSKGWSRDERHGIMSSFKGERIVFVNPIPGMIKVLATNAAIQSVKEDLLPEEEIENYNVSEVLVFTNDDYPNHRLMNSDLISNRFHFGWYLE